MAFENFPDELVPDPRAQKEFGVSAMTFWRWDHSPELGFPAPVRINGRKYRSRRALELFKQRQAEISPAA